ncbi:hypothetical protein EBS80_01205 [bacterium]|nr:hypothetical protein [bacterium]
MVFSPFVGIMGVQSPEEGARLARLTDAFSGHGHRLLLGAYADWWTFHGATHRPFLPSREDLASICAQENGAAHAVHFTPMPERDLAEQLFALMATCPNLSVLILHAVWPKRDTLVLFRRQWPNVSLVLWVSEECFIDLAERTTRVAHRIAEYARIGAIDSVMLDLAAGNGSPVDEVRAAYVLRLIRQGGVALPFGLAGGLSADRFDTGFSRVMREYNPLSLSASRRLRRDGRLDADLARRFTERALFAASSSVSAIRS